MLRKVEEKFLDGHVRPLNINATVFNFFLHLFKRPPNSRNIKRTFRDRISPREQFLSIAGVFSFIQISKEM